MTHSLLRKIIINDGTAEVVIFLQVLKGNWENYHLVLDHYHDLLAISTVLLSIKLYYQSNQRIVRKLLIKNNVLCCLVIPRSDQ